MCNNNNYFIIKILLIIDETDPTQPKPEINLIYCSLELDPDLKMVAGLAGPRPDPTQKNTAQHKHESIFWKKARQGTTQLDLAR